MQKGHHEGMGVLVGLSVSLRDVSVSKASVSDPVSVHVCVLTASVFIGNF